MKERLKAPELRFDGFTDDWEEHKLGEVGKTKSGIGFPDAQQGGKQGTPFYKVSDMNNPGNEVVMMNANNYASDSQLKENKWNPINPQNSGVVFAKVGAAIFLDRKRIVDTSFLIDNNMMSYLFDSSWNRYFGKTLFEKLRLSRFAQVGALPSFNGSDVEDIKVMIPEESEQKMIGDMFEKLDDTIALHQRKLDLLKEQKKGYLQKMFPKNGAKVPELRFAGFADDWEERKFGDFSDVRDGTHASPKYISEGHPMVTSKNLTHSGLDMTDVSFLTDEDFDEINKRSKVSIGDILFGMIGTIGNPVIVYRDDFAIKNVALIKEKSSNPIINKWLLQYLKSPSFNRFIQKENAGGTQKFIALGLIRDMNLRVPKKEEQQKIGSFFKHLDDTIALHQRKLDLLKEQKKGFLQKMFM
ncbi:restriction endonuclease subunit S [Lactococcus raffinolactis]|uniref:restriction endonuclease subunit S n=1 Tax=Pseudolactococcus raffinolactis TaxID=1366 RepID=UPI001C6FD2FA|nr:restriction endonuclease subunit S [Lactococcus raffinolactis]MBW9299146.1 restriction endonuclease subunit S [Lactococcus raffinolactis]